MQKDDDIVKIKGLENKFNKYLCLQDSIRNLKKDIISQVCERWDLPIELFDVDHSFIFKANSGKIAIALYRQIFKEKVPLKHTSQQELAQPLNDHYSWELTFVLKDADDK